MKKKTKSSSSLENRELKAKKKEIIIMNNNEEASSSSYTSYSTSNPNSTRRVSRVAHRLRKPTVRLGMFRRSVGERQAQALALPLGISFAVFTNLVLERSASGQNVHVDDLALISASAVEESLANVYGDRLGSFATNFERSFKSTLRILKLTSESTLQHQLKNDNVASFDLDRSTSSDPELSATETSSDTSVYIEIQGGARENSSMNEISLHEETRQLSVIPRSSARSLTTMEQSLEEQARANDLKCVEIGLTMKKLMLKETELALRYESNNLEKSKIVIGVSKAEFRTEKFKTELEATRKIEMVTKMMDWLILSVFTMLGAMSYGAYVFSKEASSICKPPEGEETSSPWWVPDNVLSLNTKFFIWICQVQVWVQTMLGVLMILVFTYFVIRNSSVTKQTMPVTYILLFLGVFCGFVGKFCVDLLGGNGKLWLFLWGMHCFLQLVANYFALALYGLINGSVTVTQGTNPSRCTIVVPYWARSFFLGLIMFVIPLITGLLPFATFGEWRDHFGVLVSLWWGFRI